MARVRQARRCTARRSDGEPCRGWAIVGGTVCRAHGGAAPQVRAAARRRLLEADARRAVADAWERYVVASARWDAERVAVTSARLGVAPEDVTVHLIAWCQVLYGVPARWEDRPRITTVGGDRRLRANRGRRAAM